MLTDIPATVTDEDGLVVVQQEYSVQFRSDADVPPSMKSGNPGYIFGRPIPVIPHRIGYLGVLGAIACLLYTSPSPRDRTRCRMPSSA